jgi:hypothetical protein
VDDEISSQVLPLPTFCNSVPSRELHCTHLCFLFQKVVFRRVKCYKCLKSFIQLSFSPTSIRMLRKCVHSTDNFCYTCGEVTFSSQKLAITPIIRKAYHLHFGSQIGDQDKSWAPHICCNTCAANLRKWLSLKRRSMPFAIPMVWRQQTSHISDCYFCMVHPLRQGFSKKKKCTLRYPNITSATRPVPHGEGLPVPEAPEIVTLE